MPASLFNQIKESIINIVRTIFKSRLAVLIIFFSLLSFVLVQRLFTLQIVKGQDYLDNYTMSIEKTKVIKATRGNIYDRDGELLAGSRLAYSVEIEDNGSYESNEQKNKLINETITTVIEMIEANGDTVVSDFGIMLNDENEYEFRYAEGTRRYRFLADIFGYTTIDKLSPKEKESIPQDIIDFLCANKREKDWGFGIDQKNNDKNRVLQLVTIRYGMHQNSFKKYYTTTIASDVSDKTVAIIKET